MEAKSYQNELYKRAKEGNVIIKLNTGSGKTFIASMLIKDYLNNFKAKKIFFLVKNASLAQQHAIYLRQYLFLKDEVGFFHGNMNNSWVDFWSKDKWATEIEHYKVIIMTAKVFLDILNHKKYSIDDICLLIFDEVHHLSKADDYVQISEHLSGINSDIKILGLTACLIKNVKKVKDIDFLIDELESRLKCQIVTSRDSVVNEFSTNIRNVFVDFISEISDDTEALKRIIDSSLEKINLDCLPTSDQITEINNAGFMTEENTLQSTKRHLKDLSSILTTLGIIPCKYIVDTFIRDLPNLMSGIQFLDENSQRALKEFSDCLSKLQEEIPPILRQSKRLNCSPKCKQMIRYITDMKSSHPDEEYFILIFVTERIHALAINELLNLLPSINADFSSFKSEFVIGHTTCTYPKKLEMSGKVQIDILTRFRERKFNILVATNVVEEGLDIPHCNVVIKFDPPSEFRSYLQSKGRARAQDSQYVILVMKEELGKVKLRIDFYDQVNKKINETLKSRAIDNEVAIDEFDGTVEDTESNKTDYMPYGKSGPRITLNSSAGVLNRYIGKLRCNSLSEIKILYKTEENMCNMFETTLLLPMPSPYLDEIKVGFYSNKRLSKQYANLEACKILHSLDELDQSLLPYNRYDEEEEEEDDFGKKSGTPDIGRYEKYVAMNLSTEYHGLSTSAEVLYLYSIRYSPQVFLKLGIEDCSTFDKSSSIGILLPRPIHETKVLAKFPIYLVGGKCYATVLFERKMSVTAVQSSLLLDCHRVLFEIYAQRIRKFKANISFSPTQSKCAMIITILRDYRIDFDSIKQILTKKTVVNLTDNCRSGWLGSVIRPTYLIKEFGAYIVTQVCTDTNSHSKMKKKDVDYRSYYETQYKISLTEEEAREPLVKVKRLTTIQSCMNKEKRSLKKSRRLQRINSSNIFMIPCLTECISLSSSLWTQLCIFPTIHIRLNQIFIVQEFSSTVDFIDLSTSSEVFEIDFDTCYNIENLSSEDLYVDVVNFVNNIFPCFVSKMCNDRVDLEQYEILGDSFLKFITTKYLFHFSRPTDNEGKLTQRRSKLISNKNLFKLAQQRNLSKFFFSFNFDPKDNYLPPNFVVFRENYSSTDVNERTYVSYKSKSLADCVEALLGSMLTNYGMKYAVLFLLWMGMDLLSTNEDDNEDIEVIAPAPALYFRGLDIETFVPASMSELEKILNYTFKYKAYLVQAITHPTSIENRKFSCYQRLEFLGDAVLDFLVTSYIMINNPKMRPGRITNLRSALVSNSTFAFLSAKWELHKFLNHFDSKMFFALPDVVNELLKNKLDTNTLFLKKSEQQKVIVKVLGDIFESIAGAIFLDSNYDLEVVWRVYERLMHESLKKFSYHVPKNKITLLYEKYPKLKCVFQVEDVTNLVILTATLPDGSTVETKENNKILCKLSLADKLMI